MNAALLVHPTNRSERRARPVPLCHPRSSLLVQVWSHVYGRDNLNVAPEDHAVLLTEAPLNPYKNRRQCAETFFENFGVPAMFCAPQVREGMSPTLDSTFFLLPAFARNE